MNVYTFSEARQKLASILERARKDGEVQIQRRDGQSFVLKPIKTTKSPLDVPGINLNLSSKDIVDIVREMRERN
jgi:antitoxin (DNA-binding transcriptional repressor) of toxin-antitoxin stability system